MMKIRLARNQVGRGERTRRRCLRRTAAVDIKELLADLRELAHGIHPPVLSDGGLVAAVEARAARLPFDVRLLRAHDPAGPPIRRRCRGRRLFRGLRGLDERGQALRCHTAPRSTLSSTHGRAVGRGARRRRRLCAHRRPAGSGLTNLRDRVEALGGRFGVEPRPDGAPGSPPTSRCRSAGAAHAAVTGLRVVIAEDNYLVREGTRRLLEDSGDVEVIAAVGTADELLDAVDGSNRMRR